jgi:hypothetical protein
MPNRRAIAAAIEAHNGQGRERLLLLPPNAVRLLALMFPWNTVYRRSA